MSDTPKPAGPPAVLYCHCRNAQIVPPDVKAAVLDQLCASNLPFEAVPDLCELSARRDPALRRIASGGPVKIAACFPRAVKWLFSASGAPLDAASVEVVNMRVLPPGDAATALLSSELTPNLPAGKPVPSDAPKPSEAPTV
jgi:hypothetical protein